MNDIFISYSSKDTAITNKYQEKIRQSQISIAVLLLIFFLGSTFLLCGITRFLNGGVDPYTPDTMDVLSTQIRNLFIGSIVLLICWKIPIDFLKKATPYLSAIFIVSLFLLGDYRYGFSLNGFYFSPLVFGYWCSILVFALLIAKYKSLPLHGKMSQSYIRYRYIFYLLCAGYICFILLIDRYSLFLAFVPFVIAFGISFTFTDAKKFHRTFAVAFVILCLLFAIAVFNGAAANWGIKDAILEYLRFRLSPSEPITNAIKATTFGSAGFSYDIFKAESLVLLEDNVFVALFHMGWSVAITVVMLYGFLLFHIYRIAKICLDSESYFLGAICYGVLFHIGFCAAYHICMNLNLLPLSGCSLPFVSDWGNEFLLGEIGLVFAAGSNIIAKH